jgi:hypothetical protein
LQSLLAEAGVIHQSLLAEAGVIHQSLLAEAGVIHQSFNSRDGGNVALLGQSRWGPYGKV